MGRRQVKQLVSPPQDRGGDGAKELDSLKSDRLRTVQLNVCSSEEVENAVEIVRLSLKDPEKGRATLGQWGERTGHSKGSCLTTTLHLLVSCQRTPPFAV